MTAVSFPFRNSDFAFASAKALHHGAVNCETSETVCSPDGAFDLGDICLPMGDIDLWGDWDCRDWLKEGVDWWRKEIAALFERPNLLAERPQK